MSIHRLLLRCLWAGFILTVLLQAQESQWQDLNQIKSGTRVQVVEQSLKSTSGRLVRVSEKDLTLKVENNEVVIPQERVYRVSVAGRNRKRNLLIGLAIGGGAGAGLGAAASRVVGNAVIAPAIAGWAGIGAGIGAICPSAKTVYRAEVPKQASLKEQSHRE